MTPYSAYSYSANLTEEEQAIIDQDIKKSREEFGTGFQKGLQMSVSVYFLYKFKTAAEAHAADILPDLCSDPPDNSGAVQSASNAKPGFQTLSERARGTLVGGAGAVCNAAPEQIVGIVKRSRLTDLMKTFKNKFK